MRTGHKGFNPFAAWASRAELSESVSIKNQSGTADPLHEIRPPELKDHTVVRVLSSCFRTVKSTSRHKDFTLINDDFQYDLGRVKNQICIVSGHQCGR